MIHKGGLPKEVKTVSLNQTKTLNTIAGNMTTSKMIVMRELRFPTFDKNPTISEQKVLVFH